MARRPYAYLRKSRILRPAAITDSLGRPVHDSDGKQVMTKPRVISPEMQLAEVRELAKRHGDELDSECVLQDLNFCGRKGRDKRRDYDRLLSAIEADEVSTLYSYSLSRLSRRVADIIELFELCVARGTVVFLARDVSPDPTTATGKLLLGVLAAMAQFESDVTSERMTDIAEFRRQRGDHLGGKFFPEPEKVRDAFLEAGTLAGAARLLKRQGVKTRNGGSVWSAEAIRGILDREFPEEAPANLRHQGAKTKAPYWFYRLVVCHCGRVMTARRDKPRPSRPQLGGAVRYICANRLDPDHGRAYMPELRVREAVLRELDLLELPFDAVAADEEAAGRKRLAELAEERERIGWAMTRGMVPLEDAIARQAEIDETMATIELASQALSVSIEDLDWSDLEGTNDILRALFESIELTPEMEVRRLVWRVPEWRREPPIDGAA